MVSIIFDKPKPIIGVVQLLPLPSSIGWQGRIDSVIARAEQEASALATGGVDAILVENTFDMPYPYHRLDTAAAIAMGLIVRRIMHFTDVPMGVAVHQNDPETALAIAMNVGARFIRVPVLTGVAVGDSGLIEGKSRDLAAYRQQLQVEGIAVWADVSPKRLLSHALQRHADTTVLLKTLAHEAIQAGADSVILTDEDLSPMQIHDIKRGVDAPVLFAYNHPIMDSPPYLEACDGMVVAGCVKKSPMTGQTLSPTVDLTKVEELITLAEVYNRPGTLALR